MRIAVEFFLRKCMIGGVMLLCEAVILADQKFYCPYKDYCSVLLIDDEGGVMKFEDLKKLGSESVAVLHEYGCGYEYGVR
ncbi:putative E3 ubiquitin-protein ligase RNF217 [Senna tora]|uniref:Putative E3 ubiquitin-protein ligase RNF217 n=1 Tax=Senna tora TaxID=362788 RepID=A0A834TN43_9FABA|nr:putative E3 ubiquitin-protein ligase RNF217 [Senna tora]